MKSKLLTCIPWQFILVTTCLSNHICHHFPIQIFFTETNVLIPRKALSLVFHSELLFTFPANLNLLVSKAQPRPLPWTFPEQSRRVPLSLSFLAICSALRSGHALALPFNYCMCTCVVSPISHWFWRAGAGSSIAPAPPPPWRLRPSAKQLKLLNGQVSQQGI